MGQRREAFGRSWPSLGLAESCRTISRMFNLADGGPTRITLMTGKDTVRWRALAKDGATLPAAQATVQPANLTFDPG